LAGKYSDFGREIAEAAENIINQVYAINYKTSAYKGQLSRTPEGFSGVDR
jgi:hypothetical protein